MLDINGNPSSGLRHVHDDSRHALALALAVTNGNGSASSVLTTTIQATVTASVGAQGGSSTTTPPATGGGTADNADNPASSGQASGSVTVNVAGAPTLTSLFRRRR